ncbi:aminotransferase class I/II-fold pyridoxal phosphate-dependent enzyme [Anoxybacterium hadale]|uniref:Aminotransferase class I/II-fold pyridoxal phosphate-dependent enzyme n=1 Tax=Anoxybacterium hadale TaxID=3408580 RepID=A0ACD1AAV9_9FIRM|nr:aminotransferase class I/II-fold pyridoxal phosphate-dependent enzyme [Clostridiales bacterium]
MDYMKPTDQTIEKMKRASEPKLVHGGDIYSARKALKGLQAGSVQIDSVQTDSLALAPRLLDFSANINPLGLPAGVKKVLTEAIEGFDIYPDPLCRELIANLAVYEDVPKEWLLCGNGAADLIFRMVYAIKPKKAMVLAPTFAEYEEALYAVSCEVIRYPLSADSDFQADEGLIDALDQELDLLFLCNPNNPTGQLMSKEFLCRVLERCKELGIFLVVDECFNELLEEPERYSVKDRIQGSRNLMILKAFTKTYAMAGLRLGYCLISNGALLEALREAGQPWSVSTPAQLAGIQAMKEQDYLAESKRIIRQEQEYLISALKESGIKVISANANYIFLLDPIPRRRSLHEQLLDYGILIRNCDNYHGLGPGYYRICIRVHEDNEIFVAVLQNLSKQ